MKELSIEAVFDLTALANADWGRAYEILKIVKAETDDGSMDWAGFHEIRLKNARADETKTRALYNEALAYYGYRSRK